MSEAAPAFSFYAKDFMLGIVSMSVAARGVYITLLAYQWDRGSVPADLTELSRICGCSIGQMRKLWPAVVVKFTQGVDGLYRNARLEAERRKQETWRAMKAEAGRKGGTAKAANKQKASKKASKSLAEASLPLPSSLPSSVSDLRTVPSEPLYGGRSKRPIFSGQRFTVFEWQLEGLSKLLGSYFESFDVHSWFFDLDAQARRVEMVIPQRDNGAWLLAQTQLEAGRRGLPIAVSGVSTAGKLTTRLAAAMENIRREAES